MKNYIIKKKQNESLFSIKGIEVSIVDILPDDMDAKAIIQDSLDLIPNIFTRNIKYIKIGQFEELENRELDALYKDRTIYLTNLQKSNEDMMDDIIHEVAHSVEEEYGDIIYSDGLLEKEFLIKREKLKNILVQNGFKKNLDKYSKTRYDKELDMYFYKKVRYDRMSLMTQSLFVSPYAATSLREYFANGFENFFLSQDSYQIIRKTSPVLFKKLITLLSLEEK